MLRRGPSEHGQATVEYVGLVLVVAALFGTMLAVTGLAADAARLGGLLAQKLVCAVRLPVSCSPPADQLQRAYGAGVARLLRRHAPTVRFEDGEYVSLPVDPRVCRDRACADTSERGRLGRSFAQLPATAFVHVVDCSEGAGTAGYDCSGPRAGYLYLQYWLYYPDSATRPFGSQGYHRDDWESVQIRVGGDHLVESRASSHHGYNYDADPVSDLGAIKLGPLSVDTRAPAWGPASGFVWVSSGSHAGRVVGEDGFFRSVPAGRLRLLPLEPALGSFGELDFEIVPPWQKSVWSDPEHTGT
jgi:hypothetical protein